MEKKFFEDFVSVITENRLSVYKADECDDTTALSRYLFNIEICKSLYPCLDMFEISLRNSVDIALQEFTNTSDWYNNINLKKREKDDLVEAEKRIRLRHKEPTHNRIVAEQTFGFWTSLFSKTYAQEKFHPFLIRRCFNKAPKSERDAVKLANNLEDFRLLRNRVFHYERIIHWKNLKEKHEKLLQFTKWLSPEAYEILSKIDKFEEVYNTGRSPLASLVDENFNLNNDKSKTEPKSNNTIADEGAEKKMSADPGTAKTGEGILRPTFE